MSDTSGAFVMRARPEDFRVDEEPLYAPTGDGGHTFLRIEKRGETTERVVGALSRATGVARRDIGYAGRKDRHAVTTQWMSVPALDPEQALALELEGARVLEAQRHPHKLRTGQLAANRFEIVLRPSAEQDGVASIALADLEARAEQLRTVGFANRFGRQRFGRDGDNAEQARALLGGARPKHDRRAARFLLSAWQAEVFNAWLETRPVGIDALERGDLARVEESGGLFWVDDLERETPRARAFEISATGPIFGTKMRVARDEAGIREEALLREMGVPEKDALRLPRGLRLLGTRRPVRARPLGLEVETVADAAGTGVRVCCRLAPGAYVTVLLEALVGEVRDVGGAD